MLVHVWGACGPGLTGPGLRAAPGDPGLSQKVAPAPHVRRLKLVAMPANRSYTPDLARF